MITKKTPKIRKRAQAWLLDFLIATVIASTAFALVFLSFPFSGEDSEAVRLQRSLGMLSSSVISEGQPENWNRNNFLIPGILSDGALDPSKFIELSHLSDFQLRESLGIYPDVFYCIFLKKHEVIIIDNILFIGSENCFQDEMHTDSLVETRIVSNGTELISVVFKVWRE